MCSPHPVFCFPACRSVKLLFLVVFVGIDPQPHRTWHILKQLCFLWWILQLCPVDFTLLPFTMIVLSLLWVGAATPRSQRLQSWTTSSSQEWRTHQRAYRIYWHLKSIRFIIWCHCHVVCSWMDPNARRRMVDEETAKQYKARREATGGSDKDWKKSRSIRW